MRIIAIDQSAFDRGHGFAGQYQAKRWHGMAKGCQQ